MMVALGGHDWRRTQKFSDVLVFFDQSRGNKDAIICTNVLDFTLKV